MDPWSYTYIRSKTGPSSFTVDFNDGRRVRRHLDQLKKNTSTPIDNGSPTMAETDNDLVIPLSNQPTVESPHHDVPSEPTSESSTNELRYSNQARHPPNVFQLTLISTIVLGGKECCMYVLCCTMYVYLAVIVN